MRCMPIAALLPLVLAGCAGPVSVHGQNDFFIFVPGQGPQRAARCIVQNAKKHSPALITESGPGRDAYVWEVTVADGAGVLATARADVSAIVVRIHSPRVDNEKFATDLVGYC